MAARRGRSQRRFRILPSILLTVVILLLPVGVYVWGRYAGAFRVQKIVLTGVRRVPPKRALTLLETRYRGRNLFTVSADELRRQLAVYPYFRSVHVSRDFPDTLRVTVTEYRPVACLLADGAWYVVAADGYVITALRKPVGGTSTATHATPTTSTTASASSSTSSTGATASATTSAAGAGATSVVTAGANGGTGATTAGSATATPVGGTAGASATSAAAQAKAAADQAAAALAATLVAGPPVPPKPHMPAVFTLSPVKVGTSIADPQLRVSLAVIGTLPAALSREAAYVRVNVAGNVRVYLRDGLKVDFGDDARLSAKMLALKAVLVCYAHRHVTPTYVDVSVPDRPLATPLLAT